MKKRILCLLLIVLTLSLVGCKGDVVSNKVVFDESKIEYSKDTKVLVQNSIFDLLKNILGTKVSDQTILDISSNVCDIVLNENIQESKLVYIFEKLSNNSGNITNEYKDYADEKEITTSYTLDLVSEIISNFSLQSVSNILYGIINYRYEYKIDNTTLESRKNSLRNEREIFLSIPKITFYNLLKSVIMIKNVLSLDESKTDSLQDSELVLFISKLNFDISLTKEQWNIVIVNARSIPLSIGNLCKDIYNNGDQEIVGNILNNTFSLLSSKCKSINEDIVKDYKNGNTEQVIETFITSLSQEEKVLFNNIFDNKLDSGYLDYLENNDIKNDIISSQNKTYQDMYTCQSGNYYSTFCGVIRNIFYD